MREDFQELRELDRAGVPPFDAMMLRAPPRSSARRAALVVLLPVATLTVALAAAFVLWIAAPHTFREPPPAIAKVQADPEPLGFLLDEPMATLDFDWQETK
jgi:hypothetical protein